MQFKRVTLFSGHYGSGKTNIAVNYALRLKSGGIEVVVADLDTVNPYFRTKDSSDVLEEAGIRIISSQFANTNLDIPALPAEAYAVVQDKRRAAVIDVGGDDAGAVALGRYVPYILEENDYDMFFVINRFRPLTGTAEETVQVMREIEHAAKLPFTAIINNSNLGHLTTAEDVLSSVKYADEVSKLSGLEVRYTTVKEDIAPALRGKIDNLFELKLHVYQTWSTV